MSYPRVPRSTWSKICLVAEEPKSRIIACQIIDDFGAVVARFVVYTYYFNVGEALIDYRIETFF